MTTALHEQPATTRKNRVIIQRRQRVGRKHCSQHIFVMYYGESLLYMEDSSKLKFTYTQDEYVGQEWLGVQDSSLARQSQHVFGVEYSGYIYILTRIMDIPTRIIHIQTSLKPSIQWSVFCFHPRMVSISTILACWSMVKAEYYSRRSLQWY